MWFFKKKIKNKELMGVLGPEPTDIRDYQLASIQPEVIPLPAEFDLRSKMTSVQQQFYGTCTSHAVDAVKEFLDSQEYNKEIKLSQKFIYINTKNISGLWNTEGDYVRNALKSVCDYGAPLEEDFPDIKNNNWEEYVRTVIPEDVKLKAEEYKGKTYWSVGNSLDDFRQAIYQQKAPVVFSMEWFSSYNKPEADGKIPLPDKSVGGHAVTAVGWTQDKLWVKNSWGEDWGLNGYFYIPFEDFKKHEIWSAWILLDLPKPKELIGWAAGEYLKETGLRFHPGDEVSPTCNLNLRESPTTSSAKVALLKPSNKCEIIEGGISKGGYVWWKIKTKL